MCPTDHGLFYHVTRIRGKTPRSKSLLEKRNVGEYPCKSQFTDVFRRNVVNGWEDSTLDNVLQFVSPEKRDAEG